MTKLFLDLDGVLADFNRGVETITGRRPDQQSARTMWAALARAPDFFGTLELMADARTLWDHCLPHRPVILTGLPLGSWAAAQKRRWVAAMLGAEVEVVTCMARDKPDWSGPGHVLVDDREKTKDRWEARGGAFILHRTAADSIRQLRALGL
ncbi:hypothetical protein [Oleisolibacter albus]|uniref:hypothetical protein n=1 Tax=Oleisolibacter albus TaxID=2171757 RepID=UPI000DF30C94|nr:hypothetical protein [Oleisolibacter albus]